MSEQPSAAQDLAAEVEAASWALAQDFKYPVDVHGRPMLVNQLHPDLMPTLVYHLIRCGWRKDPARALIKPRRITGSPFADLVTWVPLTDPDEPIRAPEPERKPLWSVRPQINDIHEKRPD